jgi:hypothetical protein
MCPTLDRGGGREPKGASLKKSKKNPGSTAAKAKRAPVDASGQAGAKVKLPAPRPLHAEVGVWKAIYIYIM